jgi:hypothetical protein
MFQYTVLVILFDFAMFCFIFSFMFESHIVELDLSSFLWSFKDLISGILALMQLAEHFGHMWLKSCEG